jgi:hypothetical protein
MHQVKAVINPGATSICISRSLLRRLQSSHKPAFTSSPGLNGQVMMSPKDSRKASLLVQYFELLKPVDVSEVLVFPMKVCYLGLGLAWFKGRNPDIDWTNGRWTAPRARNGPQRAHFPELYHASCLPEPCERNTNVAPPTDIQ